MGKLYTALRPLAHGLTLAEAAAMLQLEECDVLAAIEEAGRCDGIGPDGDELTLIEEGGS